MFIHISTGWRNPEVLLLMFEIYLILSSHVLSCVLLMCYLLITIDCEFMFRATIDCQLISSNYHLFVTSSVCFQTLGVG